MKEVIRILLLLVLCFSIQQAASADELAVRESTSAKIQELRQTLANYERRAGVVGSSKPEPPEEEIRKQVAALIDERSEAGAKELAVIMRRPTYWHEIKAIVADEVVNAIVTGRADQFQISWWSMPEGANLIPRASVAVGQSEDGHCFTPCLIAIFLPFFLGQGYDASLVELSRTTTRAVETFFTGDNAGNNIQDRYFIPKPLFGLILTELAALGRGHISEAMERGSLLRSPRLLDAIFTAAEYYVHYDAHYSGSMTRLRRTADRFGWDLESMGLDLPDEPDEDLQREAEVVRALEAYSDDLKEYQSRPGTPRDMRSNRWLRFKAFVLDRLR